MVSINRSELFQDMATGFEAFAASICRSSPSRCDLSLYDSLCLLQPEWRPTPRVCAPRDRRMEGLYSILVRAG